MYLIILLFQIFLEALSDFFSLVVEYIRFLCTVFIELILLFISFIPDIKFFFSKTLLHMRIENFFFFKKNIDFDELPVIRGEESDFLSSILIIIHKQATCLDWTIAITVGLIDRYLALSIVFGLTFYLLFTTFLMWYFLNKIDRRKKAEEFFPIFSSETAPCFRPIIMTHLACILPFFGKIMSVLIDICLREDNKNWSSTKFVLAMYPAFFKFNKFNKETITKVEPLFSETLLNQARGRKSLILDAKTLYKQHPIFACYREAMVKDPVTCAEVFTKMNFSEKSVISYTQMSLVKDLQKRNALFTSSDEKLMQNHFATIEKEFALQSNFALGDFFVEISNNPLIRNSAWFPNTLSIEECAKVAAKLLPLDRLHKNFSTIFEMSQCLDFFKQSSHLKNYKIVSVSEQATRSDYYMFLLKNQIPPYNPSQKLSLSEIKLISNTILEIDVSAWHPKKFTLDIGTLFLQFLDQKAIPLLKLESNDDSTHHLTVLFIGIYRSDYTKETEALIAEFEKRGNNFLSENTTKSCGLKVLLNIIDDL